MKIPFSRARVLHSKVLARMEAAGLKRIAAADGQGLGPWG